MSRDIIPEPIEFEWNKGNADKNFKKHGVENEEAEDIFLDELSKILYDEKHSIKEKRYLILGKTITSKFLSVIFTVRKEKIRIISARMMNRKERELYEEET